MKPRIKNIDNNPLIDMTQDLIFEKRLYDICFFTLFELLDRKEFKVLVYIIQNVKEIREEHRLIIKDLPMEYKKQVLPYLL